MKKTTIAFFTLLATLLANSETHAGTVYLKSLSPTVDITPLLTVGESRPRTSKPSQAFRLIGVPDGLGLEKTAQGSYRLWINHELKKSDVSQPVAGEPLQKGAFVSQWILSPEGRFVSGDFAASTYLMKGQPWTGIPTFFCSSSLAGPEVGFDRSIYLTGEESNGSDSGDGLGGLGFAFTEGRAYALPGLGRYRKENLIVVPGTGLKTVVFGLEDSHRSLNSELYLYIGQKNLSSSDPLERNGLVGGNLYVFGSETGGKGDEAEFRKTDRPVLGRWVLIDAPADLTGVQLDAKAVEPGALRFDRIEDGAYDRLKNGVFYFVTTGGGILQNLRGRLYRLTFNPNDPLKGPNLLEILLESDSRDGIVNPDNIDINASGEMIILEDFTSFNLPLMLGRNPSVWLYRPDGDAKPVRIAEVENKLWEASGVIDASSLYGPGSWLLDVQAHTIGSREASQKQGFEGDVQLVEGGQILLLRTH